MAQAVELPAATSTLRPRSLTRRPQSRRGATVYSFYFAHGPRCGRRRYGVESGWADHGDELPFSFGSSASADCEFSAAEGELARAMRRAWGSFARCGAPTCSPAAPATGLVLPAWPPYDAGQRRVMELQLAPALRSQFRATPCASFWYSEYQSIRYDGGP